MYHTMGCAPCYIPPERMRQLAITELRALDCLSDDMWIESMSVRLGPTGFFTHREVHKSSKMGRFIRASCAIGSWRDTVKGLDVRRAYARRQVFVALLGYASLWLADTGVVDETGRSVAPGDRVVLDPERLIEGMSFMQGSVSSSDDAEELLRSLVSVPLTAGNWMDRVECVYFVKCWNTVHSDDVKHSSGDVALLHACTCSLRWS